MASSFKARARRALAGGLGAVAVAALAPLGIAQPAAAATTPICTSKAHPALAAKLSRDIASALRGRTDTYAFAVSDPRTGVTCALHSYNHFDSASVVKATIMATVLWKEKGKYLTQFELDNLHPMIENSDNTAATNLWNYLGTAEINAFLKKAGMTETVLGQGGLWGLTQITARDEMKLLDVLTDRTDVLTSGAKSFAQGLMAHVEPDQRWGTPYGTPKGVAAHVKNGWLQRSATLDWRVNSLGIFNGSGRDYRMVVLTDNESTESYGITTIERVALQVHRDLGMYGFKAAVAPRAAAQQPLPQPGSDAPRVETSDGSDQPGSVKR